MRPLALLALAVLLTGCPDRESLTEEVGGRPGRLMEKMKQTTEEAYERDGERRRRAGGE